MNISWPSLLFLQIFCATILVHCQSVQTCREPYPDEQVFQYIYVDANTGASSGGHTAVVFDKTVFHYQNQRDGFFKFERTGFMDFYTRYSELENRRIYVHDIAVTKKSYDIIYKQLLGNWLIQEKNFNLYYDAIEEIKLLKALAQPHKLPEFQGSGLFDTNRYLQVEIPPQLQSRISKIISYKNQLYDFLENPDIKIKQEYHSPKLAANTYPKTIPFPASDYIDKLQAWIAMQALIQGWPLHFNSYFDSLKLFQHDPKMLKNFQLSTTDIQQLKKFQTKLISNMVEMIEHPTPGNGQALLLALARWQIIEKSIHSGYIAVLDPFPKKVIRLDQKSMQRHPAKTRKSQQRLLNRFTQVRDWTYSQKNINEMEYNSFENIAGFYLEVIQSQQINQPTRMMPKVMIPGKKKALDIHPFLSAETIAKLGDQSKKNLQYTNLLKNHLAKELHRVYDYNVFRKNCATELVENINKSFGSKTVAKEQMGGWIDKNTNFLFVPFLSYDIIGANWRVIQSRKYLPRRMADLRVQAKNSDTSFLDEFKESIAFSSSSYEPVDEDTAFIIFSDHLFWLRPLSGLINSGYGLAYSLYGIIWSPVDQGAALKRGLLGTFWSLPELGFFNVRKGTYLIPAWREPQTQSSCNQSLN